MPEHEVECVAKNSAKLCGLITMFIQDSSPDSSEASQFTVDLPVLSARDVDLITALGRVKFQASDCIDFISLSYCNTAEHVKQARAFLDEIGLKNTNIVAKVETKKGLCNFGEWGRKMHCAAHPIADPSASFAVTFHREHRQGS